MNLSERSISGLTTLFVDMPGSQSTTVQVFVRAGSIYESRESNGLSHFLEHMFFKGGKRYKTPKEVAQAIESFGGSTNAYTGHDIASYYIKCPPQYANKAIDILGDMMTNAQFPQAELEREAQVVVQEIKMYADQPQSVMEDAQRLRYYGDNPYGWTILGSMDNVLGFTREDLLEHQHNLYTLDNLILVIAGKIENQQELEEAIATHFAGLTTTHNSQQQAFVQHLPSESSAFIAQDTQQNHLLISAPSFAYKTGDTRRQAANILTTILGGNMSSRLFQNIREQLGLCYYIGASHDTTLYDGGFEIYAGIDKSRFEEGLEAIYRELEIFTSEGCTYEEFEAAKAYRIAKLQMGIESSNAMSGFIGTQYLLHNTILSLEELIAIYRSLELDDLQPLFSYLDRDNLYTYHIE